MIPPAALALGFASAPAVARDAPDGTAFEHAPFLFEGRRPDAASAASHAAPVGRAT